MEKALCIAGVFGGADSGVKSSTKYIFRKRTGSILLISVKHRSGMAYVPMPQQDLKNVDISNTLNVLKRATLMIVEIAGGEIEL